jgi:hypothetical protein
MFSDLNVILALGATEHFSPSSPSILPLSAVERTVDVVVDGRVVRIPEHALSEPLAVLCLGTEGYVGLQNYAESVAWTMEVLARCGLISFPASQPVRD